jgi:hypothetical protein
MEFKEPTFEEYKKATKFARFRYRWGFLIITLSWLLFLFTIIYMVTNIEVIKSNPLVYAMEKGGLKCHCSTEGGQSFFVDAVSIRSSPFLDREGNILSLYELNK